MTGQGPEVCLDAILSLSGDDSWRIDRDHAVRNLSAYVIRSFDEHSLIFAVPLRVSRPLLSEIPLDSRGSAGAVALIIEKIKQNAGSDPRLGPLIGRGTRFPHQFSSFTEPYTLVASPAALACDLWHAGPRNCADASGIRLLINGALPCPGEFSPREVASFTEAVAHLCDAIADIACAVPAMVLEDAWLSALDQQLLRDVLPERGLVSFVGDGSRLARTYTRHRCHFRTAGPKEDVNIPFTCPIELGPCDLELPASGGTVTGLGIRKKEVCAVAGSNAQGKTTFLEGIIAGVDDHAPGDGRELVVTVQGTSIAEALNCQLNRADVSMFFSSLPPGIRGTVRAASGMGSGSMNMASQVQQAIERHVPLLIIDEDRAAPNLLVQSCIQTTEITPLSEILARDRLMLGETTIIFAACAMDTLVAQADRIMLLDQHVAHAVDRTVFRSRVADSLEKMARDLRMRE